MSYYRKVSLVLAATAVLLIGLALPGRAMAATAAHSHARLAQGQTKIIPFTGSGCNTQGLANWYNCTTVVGSGLKITSVSGYTLNYARSSLSNMHVEIYGPNGLIKNCSPFTLPGGGQGPTCTWTNPSPNATMTAGDYCSVAWQYQGNNYYAEGAPECIGVHA
jgi:hypothetical protein